MKNNLEFSWRGKLYKGWIVSERNGIWWVVLDNSKSYLLAKDEEGWFSPSLKRALAALIGEQLDQQAEYTQTNQEW